MNSEFTTYEEENVSRRLTGFNVFIAHYSRWFRELDEQMQWQHVNEGIRQEQDGECPFSCEDSDLDSTDTTAIPYRTIFTSACSVWRNMLDGTKMSWKTRATKLNDRPLLGGFESLPREVRGDLELVLRRTLTEEWSCICKMLWRSIRNGPNRGLSEKHFAMGCVEKVKVGSQSYRRFHLSHLMRLCLFGINYQKLNKAEMIYRSKHVTIMHFASMRRVNRVFSL